MKIFILSMDHAFNARIVPHFDFGRINFLLSGVFIVSFFPAHDLMKNGLLHIFNYLQTYYDTIFNCVLSLLVKNGKLLPSMP